MKCVYELQFTEANFLLSRLREIFREVCGTPEELWGKDIEKLENTALFVKPSFYKGVCGNELDFIFSDLMNGWQYNNVIRFSITDPRDPQAQKNYGLHIDCNSKGYVIPAILNFPILNCNLESVTNWYQVTRGTVRFNANYCSYEMPEENSYSLCDSFSIGDQPVLFKSNIHHEMINKSGKKRVLAGFLFDHWLDWEHLKDFFNQKNMLVPREY